MDRTLIGDELIHCRFSIFTEMYDDEVCFRSATIPCPCISYTYVHFGMTSLFLYVIHGHHTRIAVTPVLIYELWVDDLTGKRIDIYLSVKTCEMHTDLRLKVLWRHHFPKIILFEQEMIHIHISEKISKLKPIRKLLSCNFYLQLTNRLIFPVI